jgi:hypothetical protein
MWAGCITTSSNNQNRNFPSSNTNMKKENKHAAGEHSEFSVRHNVCSTNSKRAGNFCGQAPQFGSRL